MVRSPDELELRGVGGRVRKNVRGSQEWVEGRKLKRGHCREELARRVKVRGVRGRKIGEVSEELPYLEKMRNDDIAQGSS